MCSVADGPNRIEKSNKNCILDGVQDTLSQNIAPGHIEYFKLKVFEKWKVQERLPDLLPS